MKKKNILTLSLASLLVLSGCTVLGLDDSSEEENSVESQTSYNDSTGVESSVETQTSYSDSTGVEDSEEVEINYGDFTEVEDSGEAETTFNNVKAMNAETADVEGYTIVTEFVGSYEVNEETILLDSKVTQRFGIDGTKYASDEMITNDYGTYSNYVRFNEADNMYYNCAALNFTYTDSDTETEVTIDENMLSQDEDLNLDTSIVYDAEKITNNIPYIHMISEIDYSRHVIVYTSSNGYYKIDEEIEEGMHEDIFDADGNLVEINFTGEDIDIMMMFSYSADLYDVELDDYEERDLEYSFTFLASMMMFMTLSKGMYTFVI